MKNQKLTKIFMQIYMSLYLKTIIYYSKQLNYSMIPKNIILLKKIYELILIILNFYYLVIVIVEMNYHLKINLAFIILYMRVRLNI